MSETTEIRTRVILECVAQCPSCGKRLELRNELTEEQLSTVNMTDMSSSWIRSMKTQLAAKKDERGWTVEMCGTCRDDGPPQRK